MVQPARMHLSVLLLSCVCILALYSQPVNAISLPAEERWKGTSVGNPGQDSHRVGEETLLVQLDQKSKDDPAADVDDVGDVQQQEAMFAYSSQLNEDENPQPKEKASSKPAKKPVKAKFESDEEESMAIAGYSMEIAQGEGSATAGTAASGQQKTDKKSQTKGQKKQKDQKKGNDDEDDPENLKLSISESILDRNKQHDDITNDDDDEDSSSQQTSSKSKKQKVVAKPISEEEKQNILFWSKQDPEAKAEKLRQEQKEREVKMKQQQEELQYKQNVQALSQLPFKERQRLQHEALVEAESQINKSENKDQDASNELTDLEESAQEIDSWDKTEQFSKYMEKNAEKAQEKFVERKYVDPSQAKALKKSQDDIKKEQAAKSLDDDVESVQQLYDQENQKEEQLFQNQNDNQSQNNTFKTSTVQLNTNNAINDQHSIKSEDYDLALSTHATDKQPEDPFSQQQKESLSGDGQSLASGSGTADGGSGDQSSSPDQQTTDQQSQAQAEPTPVVPGAAKGGDSADASKKSFFEAIWERDHPDEVKKIKLAAEKKKIDEEAKRLQDQAQALQQKSQHLKDTIKYNKTQVEEEQKKKEAEEKKKKEAEQQKAMKAERKTETTDKKVARLLQEGRSLGEIQHTLQMQKPYYVQAEIEEKTRIENQEKKEMEDYIKNPLKDDTQELIDSYANAAEERTRHEQELQKNATLAKQKKEQIAKQTKYNSSKPSIVQSSTQSSPNQGVNLPQKSNNHNQIKLKTAAKPPAQKTNIKKELSAEDESTQNEQDVDLTGGMMSEADMAQAMQTAIEEKKKEKFNKMIEKGAKIAAQQKEEAMSSLIGKSFSQNQPENSDQNKVTREVLQETTEVEKEVASEPVPLPPTPEEEKLANKQGQTQEEIIDQLVATQAEEKERDIEAEVAAQMQLNGGFQDLIPQNKQQAVQDTKIKSTKAPQTPKSSNTQSSPKVKQAEQPKALKDDSMTQIAQVSDKSTEVTDSNQQSSAPKDESDSYLQKLAKDNGIDLENASVEQLQSLIKQQNDQQKPPSQLISQSDASSEPIEKQDKSTNTIQKSAPDQEQSQQSQPKVPIATPTIPKEQAQVQISEQASDANSVQLTESQNAVTTQQQSSTDTSDSNQQQSYEHIKELGDKLGIDVPPEIMQLGSNEAISETLVNVALQAGKSEEEITKVLSG